MRKTIAQYFVFPLYEMAWGGGRAMSAVKELESLEHASPEKVALFKMGKIKELLEFSYAQSPYYRKSLDDRGMVPSDVKTLSDFARLPLLSKELLHTEYQDLRARVRGTRILHKATSGSTGIPVSFCYDLARLRWDRAVLIRLGRWWGIDIGDPVVSFWTPPAKMTFYRRVKEYWDRAMNVYNYSAVSVDIQSMTSYARQILVRRPKAIFGYLGTIYSLCVFLRSRGHSMRDLGIRAVLVTTERLLDTQRALISDTFNCPVVDMYGAREIGYIAHSCPEGKLHLLEDVHLELIGTDSAADTACGEAVVTRLHISPLPLIRYRLGDTVSLFSRPCPCGRRSPTIEVHSDRLMDFLVRHDGRKLHPLPLTYRLAEVPGLAAYKLIQKKDGTMVMDMVKEDSFSVDSEKMLRSLLEDFMQEPVAIRLRTASFIPPEKNGKLKYVISEKGDDVLIPR